jgi:anti-sigma B factor antagonist
MRPAAFEDETVDDSIQLLTVSGELDMTSSGELRRLVERALHGGRNCVVIDLDGVTHMDSSALAALITAHQLVQGRGGRMALVISSESLRRTLEVRGLDRLFVIKPDRKTAVAAVCG